MAFVAYENTHEKAEAQAIQQVIHWPSGKKMKNVPNIVYTS
jgi:hypothetical protein